MLGISHQTFKVFWFPNKSWQSEGYSWENELGKEECQFIIFQWLGGF